MFWFEGLRITAIGDHNGSPGGEKMFVVAAGRGFSAQTTNAALKGAGESGLVEGQGDSERSGGSGGVTGDSEGVMP